MAALKKLQTQLQAKKLYTRTAISYVGLGGFTLK